MVVQKKYTNKGSTENNRSTFFHIETLLHENIVLECILIICYFPYYPYLSILLALPSLLTLQLSFTLVHVLYSV